MLCYHVYAQVVSEDHQKVSHNVAAHGTATGKSCMIRHQGNVRFLATIHMSGVSVSTKFAHTAASTALLCMNA